MRVVVYVPAEMSGVSKILVKSAVIFETFATSVVVVFFFVDVIELAADESTRPRAINYFKNE